MSTTIRIDDDIIDYFKEHGKFGETHSDVLRRLLPGFQTSEQSSTEASSRNTYPLLFGFSLSSVVRALGALGWSEEQARRALLGRGIAANAAMIKTQINWGKQWGKGNPHCKSESKPYGSEPPLLTAEQIAELREHLEA